MDTTGAMLCAQETVRPKEARGDDIENDSLYIAQTVDAAHFSNIPYR